MKKSKNALKTIGEVAKELNISPHVIRFWEEQFPNINPIKYNNRRYYDTKNIDALEHIKDLLYSKNYSIKNAAKIFKRPQANALMKTQHKLIAAKKKLSLILGSN